MDQRENRASASFEVRAIDDATVEVAGYAAVFNQETVIGGRIFQGRRKLQDD
jgi:phage head maturation protease